MSKKFDRSISICITTPHDEFKCIFNDKEPVKDAISWMKDTYCIEEDSIEVVSVSYITTYKRSNHD